MKTNIMVGITLALLLLTLPAAASDYTLEIFGNANEDEVLDMRDVTYIKLVIFGKKPATDFADANYDGKISMLDIGQTKLIILGKEKELTLLDLADRIVTINKPIERVVLAALQDGINTLVQLGAEDKIVGITEGIKRGGYGQLIDPKPSSWWTPLQLAAPELKDLPTVGTWKEPNLEAIISLEPDVVFGYCLSGLDTPNAIQDKTEIPTLCLQNLGGTTYSKFDPHLQIYRLVGWIVGKNKEAEELISYANEKIAEITEVTSQISDSEKPKVYFAMWTSRGSITRTRNRYDPIDLAGGINAAKGCAPISGQEYTVEVSKEQIILWNPDIILVHGVFPPHKVSVEDVLSDPDLQTINAVKNKQVYYMKHFQVGFDRATGVTETFYLAKLLHPDKFEDLDVEEENNEILKRFYGVDYLYTDLLEKSDLYRWE